MMIKRFVDYMLGIWLALGCVGRFWLFIGGGSINEPNKAIAILEFTISLAITLWFILRLTYFIKEKIRR